MTDLKDSLDRLADEADPRPFDSSDIIAKARARTRSRHTVVASALGTVAVAGAMVVTLGGTGGDNDGHVATPSGGPTTSACVDGTPEPCGPLSKTDARSRKLTEQLAKARTNVISDRWTVVTDSRMSDPLQFVVTVPDGFYVASAKLGDAAGQVEMSFHVGKAPAGATLANFMPMLAPCTLGAHDCTERTLPDGTVARAETHNQPAAMEPTTYVTALRPDGTYIQVVAGLYGARPTAPFTLDEMFEFASVFTY